MKKNAAVMIIKEFDEEGRVIAKRRYTKFISIGLEEGSKTVEEILMQVSAAEVLQVIMHLSKTVEEETNLILDMRKGRKTE